MAHALGGMVGYHPSGREMGCIDIERLPAGDTDPWLAECPPRFKAHLTHLQTVLRLPAGARVLARSAHDPHQIVRFSPTAVSMQFHPEFTSDIQAACIGARAQVLRREGMDPSAMLHELAPTPMPLALLRRFVDTHAATGKPFPAAFQGAMQ
jgi:GMP synthase (glutamine-hydrolysing)